MSRTTIISALALLCTAACSDSQQPVSEPLSFNIDETRITVSGVSAGAYMANQYHVAHSSTVAGAGLIAGGPYWCAGGSMSKALGVCMNGGDVDLEKLLNYAVAQANQGSIDGLGNLDSDSVWIFHGSNDAIVHSDVPAAAVDFYEQVADNIALTEVVDIEAPHGMPTVAANYSCATVETPFLNNCGYDAAGELLQAVAGIPNDRATQSNGELVAIPQPNADEAEMLGEALLFVPASCAANEPCGLHIVFHGCQQSTEFVENAFATGAGFNEWATNNDLLVLYPQVARSRVAPMNPLGCWDWWGYTGDDYATRSGAQISAVKTMVDRLSDKAN